ncbi:MAG: T9SS type A sorting domain-containing protein [Bacteroidales bacterium]|jgi:hypothetical protein|nr:T9SS type A sorting domain-containing protein [Bacteroidales bacterium]NLM93666.1 T9SS type A sorting domain-containing protein [Bacteroidales bacterium]
MKTKLLFLLCFFPLLVMAQWSDDSATNLRVTNLPGEEVIPKVGVGPDGHYYIGYFSLEGANYNVRLQRCDAQGNRLWAENGLLISEHPSMSWLTDWDMTVDHENHAILTWQDIRQGGNNNTVAYRISPDGEFVWGPDGIMLSSSGSFDVSPKVVITDANSAVFAWNADNVVILQKISPEGTKLWGEWGITLSGSNTYSWPQLLPVGEDEVILKIFEDSGPSWSPTRHILARRYDADGQPVWDDFTVVYNLGAIQAWYQILPFVNDGNDGFYMAWHDFSQSGTAASSWLQHVDGDGQPLLPENGVLLSNRTNFNQFYPQLAKPHVDPDVYIYWNEVNGDQNQWGIYGQKVNSEGQLLWGEQGKVIFPVSDQGLLPQFAMPLDDHVILVYEHNIMGGQTSLRALRLDKEGAFVWDPAETLISSVQSNKVHLDMAPYHGGQWVFAWEDDRSDGVDLYAQNLRTNGTLGNGSEMYSLTIDITGNGTVEVEGLPYSEPLSFEEGTTLSLEALAQDGWLFEGWSGDLVSDEALATIILSEDKSINATFVEIPLYSLTLRAVPEEGGSVDGAGDFVAGTEVTITATPASGFIFLEWEDDSGEEFGDEPAMTFSMPENDLLLKAIFQSTASVPERPLTAIRLYPNPASTRVTIRSGSPLQSVRILDITGKPITELLIAGGLETSIDLAGIEAGIYFVQVMNNHGTRVQKLQVMKP